MDTFTKFLETKFLSEADMPGAAPGGISQPGALPGGSPMGTGAPPMGGMPMGGGMGMPMGGMPGSAPQGGQAPEKLKAYNVWDVLERVLSGDGHEEK